METDKEKIRIIDGELVYKEVDNNSPFEDEEDNQEDVEEQNEEVIESNQAQENQNVENEQVNDQQIEVIEENGWIKYSVIQNIKGLKVNFYGITYCFF